MKQVKDYLREYLDAVRDHEDIIGTPRDEWHDDEGALCRDSWLDNRIDAAEALALTKLAYDEASKNLQHEDIFTCVCGKDTIAPFAEGWSNGYLCPDCHARAMKMPAGERIAFMLSDDKEQGQ